MLATYSAKWTCSTWFGVDWPEGHVVSGDNVDDAVCNADHDQAATSVTGCRPELVQISNQQ